MKTKPYPQIEEKPMKVDKPAVAYQRTDPTSYRKAQMFDHPKLEMDNMEEEWFENYVFEAIVDKKYLKGIKTKKELLFYINSNF